MEPIRVLVLASDLGPTGAARQLSLLVAVLPRDQFHLDVGVLGSADTPLAAELRDAGVPVHSLRLRGPIDVRGMRTIRRVAAAAKPALVHAWGPTAVRAAGLICTRRPDGGNIPRLVVSAASIPCSGIAGWLARRRLRRADRVVPATWAEGERYRRLDVRADSLTHIAPGVLAAPPPPDRDAFIREMNLPPNARFIAAAGRLEPSAGMKALTWAFDMLRYDFPELHLLIFGAGPDREGLEAFGRALAFDDFRIRYPGCRSDLRAVLGLAEVVWVAQPEGGVNLAVEAMAAGRPVVAWKTPELTEVVEDGVTGFLADPAERPQLSAKTYPLLTDKFAAAKAGELGRARAASHFGLARMAEQYARVYREVVGG